jgi:hypothetical protein
MRLAGATLTDLRHFVTAEKWGISDRQLRRYVEAGDKILAETLEKDREKLINLHRGRRTALFARAVDQGDFRTALAILRDQAELENIYPPKKVAPTNPEGTEPYHAGVLSDEERLTALAAIYARLGETGGGPADAGPADSTGPLLDQPRQDPGGLAGGSAGPLAGGSAPEAAPEDPFAVQ